MTSEIALQARRFTMCMAEAGFPCVHGEPFDGDWTIGHNWEICPDGCYLHLRDANFAMFKALTLIGACEVESWEEWARNSGHPEWAE